MTSALSEVIIADRLTDANQNRLLTSNLQVSWEISTAGQLSFDVPLADLVYAGLLPNDLLSRWIHYTHPTAGAWGGQITKADGNSDGIISISAESWASCLRGAWVSRVSGKAVQMTEYVKSGIDENAAQTGIKRTSSSIALANAGYSFSSALDDTWDFYETGLQFVLERMESYREYYAQTLLPHGYNVDPVTRVMSVRAAIGSDRSSVVKLAQRVHCVESSWSDNYRDFANYIAVTANYAQSVPYNGQTGSRVVCDKYKKTTTGGKKCVRSHTEATYGTLYRDEMRSATKVVFDQNSINRYGRVAESVDWPQSAFISESAMALAAQHYLRSRVTNQQLVSVTIADIDGVWSDFREGDVVAVDLADDGCVGKMVARSRALDVSRGTMIVAGEAELRRATS